MTPEERDQVTAALFEVADGEMQGDVDLGPKRDNAIQVLNAAIEALNAWGYDFRPEVQHQLWVREDGPNALGRRTTKTVVGLFDPTADIIVERQEALYGHIDRFDQRCPPVVTPEYDPFSRRFVHLEADGRVTSPVAALIRFIGQAMQSEPVLRRDP